MLTCYCSMLWSDLQTALGPGRIAFLALGWLQATDVGRMLSGQEAVMKVKLTHLAGSSGCILALTLSHAVVGTWQALGQGVVHPGAHPVTCSCGYVASWGSGGSASWRSPCHMQLWVRGKLGVRR